MRGCHRPSIALVLVGCMLLSGCVSEPSEDSNADVLGCIDESATNYDITATTDDGSCEYADSDGDGDNDVYYADSSFAGVGWVKNNGSENFVPQVVGSQVGWWTPIDSLEMTDLDEDGHKDLIYSSKSLSAVGWMANNGSENFIPSQLAGELTAVDQVQVADLDQDGDLDLVASSSEADTHAWLENNGSEGFIPHDIG